MSQVEGSGFCPTCNQQRLMRRQGTNHVLHLVLTVLTIGIWGLVWIFVAVSNKGTAPWRCSVCGTRIKRLTVPGTTKARSEAGSGEAVKLSD